MAQDPFSTGAKEVGMKKLVPFLLVVSLLLSTRAAAQNKSGVGKPFTVSAKVSEDRKTLVPTNGEPWLVVNPGALAGHEGQQVKVKCRLSSAGHDIRVLSVRVVTAQIKYAANPSDSAFRR